MSRFCLLHRSSHSEQWLRRANSYRDATGAACAFPAGAAETTHSKCACSAVATIEIATLWYRGHNPERGTIRRRTLSQV
jgi:hypothetical protein